MTLLGRNRAAGRAAACFGAVCPNTARSEVPLPSLRKIEMSSERDQAHTLVWKSSPRTHICYTHCDGVLRLFNNEQNYFLSLLPVLLQNRTWKNETVEGDSANHCLAQLSKHRTWGAADEGGAAVPGAEGAVPMALMDPYSFLCASVYVGLCRCLYQCLGVSLCLCLPARLSVPGNLSAVCQFHFLLLGYCFSTLLGYWQITDTFTVYREMI